MPDSAAFWTALGTVAMAIITAAGALYKVQSDRIKSLEDKSEKREAAHAEYVEKKQTEYIDVVKQLAVLFKAKTDSEESAAACEKREKAQAEEVRTQAEEIKALKGRIQVLEAHHPRRAP